MKNEKMVRLIYVIINFIIVIIVYIMPFVFGISMMFFNPVFGVIFLLVYVKVMRAWGEYNVHECCELQDSLESIQKRLNKQKNLREKKI